MGENIKGAYIDDVLELEFYGEELERVKEVVGKYFTVEDIFLEAGVLTFTISETEIKERFKRLYQELHPMKLAPTAKLEDGKVKIRVFKYRDCLLYTSDAADE